MRNYIKEFFHEKRIADYPLNYCVMNLLYAHYAGVLAFEKILFRFIS